MAEPDAWVIRANNKIEKVGAIAPTIVPAVNNPTAVKNKRRTEYFWIRKAVVGIIIPFTNINPVVSHCTVDIFTSKSFIIEGSATFKNVLFKNEINAPTINIAMIP
jgi:hypothetical protein